MDLICTSNSENPIFIDNDDRRAELVRCNPKYQGKKEFWDAFYAELKNAAVMSSWFHYLASFKISLSVRDKTCRFDQDELTAQKRSSMKQSHRFLVEFFQTESCFERASKFTKEDWWLGMAFEMLLGEPVLYIGKGKLYNLYRAWNEQEGLRNVLGKATFLQEMETGGVLNCTTKVRRRMHGERIYVLTLKLSSICKALGSHYSIEEKHISQGWGFHENFKNIREACSEHKWIYRGSY